MLALTTLQMERLETVSKVCFCSFNFQRNNTLENTFTYIEYADSNRTRVAHLHNFRLDMDLGVAHLRLDLYLSGGSKRTQTEITLL